MAQAGHTVFAKIGDPSSDKSLRHTGSRRGSRRRPPVDNDPLDGQPALRRAQSIGMRRGAFHILRTLDNVRKSRLFSGF
jgi:hypothetical protein